MTEQVQQEQQTHTEVVQTDSADQVQANGVDETPQPAPGAEQAKDDPKELHPAEKENKALKRRIDRLTRGKYEGEARLRQLEAELGQYRGQASGDGQHQETQLTERDVEQRAHQMREVERFNSRCNDVAASGQQQFPDFLSKLDELGKEAKLFDFDARGQAKPTSMMDAILDADDPAALIYHLGESPDMAAELAELTPRQQVRRLAVIELELKPAAKDPKPASAAAPAVTKAPPPIQPNRSASGQFTKDPEAMTDAEWWASQRKS